MAQSGWRLPADLLKRVRVHCAETGERQNAFVERALESALAPSRVAPKTGVAGGPEPAPSRTPAKKPPAELPRIAPRHWGKS